MKRYEVPVQENGRMILPVELRQALGLGKGDRVVLQRVDDRIELTTARLSRSRVQARVRAQFPDAENVVDEFLAERRAEARREFAEIDEPREGSEADR
jgi:AbrB family looped-hinge helix DNA binding protein